jgi:hypothetical protein
MSPDDDEQAIIENLLAHMHWPRPQEGEFLARFLAALRRAGLLEARYASHDRDYQSLVDDIRAETRDPIAREQPEVLFEALQDALRKAWAA